MAKENLKLQARGAATARLVDAHQDEFWSLYEQEAKDRGVEVERPLTPERKAQQDFEALVKDNPSLIEDYLAQQAEKPDQAPGQTSADGSTVVAGQSTPDRSIS